MNSTGYKTRWCDKCNRIEHTTRMFQASYRNFPWMHMWVSQRVLESTLVRTYESTCLGCRRVSTDVVKVLPVFLHKLGIRFEYKVVDGYIVDRLSLHPVRGIEG